MEELLGNIAIGVLLLIISIIYIYKQPTRINSLYGYRTPRSMKNEQNWEYANKVAAKFMLYISIMSVLLGVLITYLFESESATMIVLIATSLALVIQMPVIEQKLKKFEAKD